ncbi:MAG: UDP-N-acetylmuramoyl-L-alanine--D-glutamate ligase, partial [Candidatus Shapirobacteria bacterium]|nr:UDP-N-acetylmuramoyl-L-alanine--D-glutamate ligase [Candidatus Shapirobacteria bacterium]
MNLKNKQVLVMGLGTQSGGEGVARYLAKNGARVTVTDLKNEKELAATIKKLANLPIKYVLGQHRNVDFQTADLVIKGPGVPDNSPFLKTAKKNQVPILGEINLFWRECPSKKIIGITGTKGKTTTAFLTEKILSYSEYPVVLGGNLGVSLLDILPQINENTWVVLELSSWQLEGLKNEQSSPHISLITNIFPDHLNRYQNMTKYVAAKKLIFTYQKKNDYLILNQENSWTKKLQTEASGRVILFSTKSIPATWRSVIKIPGEHSLANIAAAAQIGKLLNIKTDSIKRVLSSFSGLPHRLEFVKTVSGVDFYNDSAATNPTASRMAIKSFNRPLVWILGGVDKNLSFSQLIKTAQKNPQLKALVFLKGDASQKIIAEAQKGLPNITKIKPFDNFSKAINAAYRLANKG